MKIAENPVLMYDMCTNRNKAVSFDLKLLLFTVKTEQEGEGDIARKEGGEIGPDSQPYPS